MAQTYASPMSFVGGTRRAVAWARRQSGLLEVLAWIVALCYLPLFWLFLVAWYVVVFGIFGIITIPIRMLRRGQRKSLAVQKAQLEAMQKMAEQSKQ